MKSTSNKTEASKVSDYCNHLPTMDCYLSENQIEALANFDYVEQDLADLIEEDQNKFNMNEYLNSNIDY